MSRSVKPDYEALKTPMHVYAREGVTIRKIGMTIPFTEEQVLDLMARDDSRFERRSEEYNVSPTNEDWAKYHRAKAGLLALQNYEDTIGADEVEIPMPRPKIKYRFTETHEEWLVRCRALQSERKAA